MSIETGVLLDQNYQPLFWHEPAGRGPGYLPDSRTLWDVLWENRARVWGFAHSHPGAGRTRPSLEDVTTFAAVEAAIGRRLVWPIITSDTVSLFMWSGFNRLSYTEFEFPADTEADPRKLMPWFQDLHRRSFKVSHG